jgi:plastocyanin
MTNVQSPMANSGETVKHGRSVFGSLGIGHWTLVIRAAFCACALAVSARAGTISGVVQAKGPDIPESASGGVDGYSSRSLKLAEKLDYSAFTDFVVYINEEFPEVSDAVATVTVTKPGAVKQEDANFSPHVLPVARGTTVKWPNADAIFHNVYSTSEAKQFDLGFYKPTDKPPEERFDKVGRVDVFCAIHTKMHCIILVVPNSYFAVADSRGRYAITGVPPGTYRVRAWHERLPFQEKRIVVTADGEVKDVNFTLTVSAQPNF